jgi:hypothetical protein
LQNHKKIKGIVNLILTKTFFAIGDFIDVSPTDVSSTDVSSMLTEATSNVVPERSSSSLIQIANER